MLLVSVLKVNEERHIMLYAKTITAEVKDETTHLPSKGTVDRYFRDSLDLLDKLVKTRDSFLTHNYEVELYFIDGLHMTKVIRKVTAGVVLNRAVNAFRPYIRTKYVWGKNISTRERSGEILACQYNQMGAENFVFVYTADTKYCTKYRMLANDNGIVLKINKDGYEFLSKPSHGYADRYSKCSGIFFERIYQI